MAALHVRTQDILDSRRPLPATALARSWPRGGTPRMQSQAATISAKHGESGSSLFGMRQFLPESSVDHDMLLIQLSSSDFQARSLSAVQIHKLSATRYMPYLVTNFFN